MREEKRMTNCPKCGALILVYTNGRSYGFCPSYPYESGEYCPNRCFSFSNLEISRGAYKKLKEKTNPERR